jgi:hypothetical protein
MRTSLFILSALVVVAACANDAESTAPLSGAAASTAVTSDQVSFQQGPGASSKPQYFSKVTIVLSAVGDLDGVVSKSLQLPANCPPGSVIVGGGYHVGGGNTNDARVLMNVPNGLTGWLVYVVTTTPVQFQTYAVCAQ